MQRVEAILDQIQIARQQLRPVSLDLVASGLHELANVLAVQAKRLDTLERQTLDEMGVMMRSLSAVDATVQALEERLDQCERPHGGT